MKKLLLTGFVPFAQHKENISQEIAIELNGIQINNFEIIGKVLPVSYQKASNMIVSLIQSETPDAVICLGIAEHRTKVTPELIAINHIHSDISDNDNVIIKNSIINSKGNEAYFSTLPVYKIIEKLKKNNIASEVSFSAGAFVCNLIFYELMHYCAENKIKIPAGFIHLPICLQKSIILDAVKSSILSL